MKQVDYIIVGCGLAGIAFCEQLIKHNRTFLVYDNQSQLSSIVAAGIYNPVTLKRFTEVWKSEEQLAKASIFYKDLEEKLNVKLDYKLPIYRRFSSVEEQNNWYSASDKPALEKYLSTKLVKNTNPFVSAPFGFGEVLHTGRVDTAKLIQYYKEFLFKRQQYISESFDYADLNLEPNYIYYKGLTVNQIVFAEGYGMVNNPYFKYLPLNVAKGEVITIKAPDLKIEYILKSSVFLVPEGNDHYSVGATYNWKDKTHKVTKEAEIELISNLKDLINCEFEVVGQRAGIRPTVKDRRPLVGNHPIHHRLSILNGLGTRGVMIGPYVAEALFHKIEKNNALANEIDISRFEVL